MPELGDPSGLVAGYDGPGAATVLPGGTQDPLAVLQQKKASAKKTVGERLASSKKATGQLKGAWDRDIPNLAGKRKAYLTLNSHWMQQGIDPRDPSNTDVYNQDREIFEGLKGEFAASAQQKKQYDSAIELLAKDREGKYNREESAAELEAWAALPIEERAQTPMPIPSLKPKEFSSLKYSGEIAKMIKTEIDFLEPYKDQFNNTIYPEEDKIPEGAEELIDRAYLEKYKELTSGPDGDSYKEEKGFQKFRSEVLAQVGLKKKRTIKGAVAPRAADLKAGQKKIDLAATRERIERMRGGDTEAQQSLIGEKHNGNTITQVTWDRGAGEMSITTEDDGGHLTVSVIDVKSKESLDQLANIITGDKMSDSDREAFKAIEHEGYDSEDTSKAEAVKVTELAGAGNGSNIFKEYEGKLLTITVGGERYDGVLEEITTGSSFWASNPQLTFKVGTKDFTIDTQSKEGKEILRQIIVKTGGVRSKYKKKGEGVADPKEDPTEKVNPREVII